MFFFVVLIDKHSYEMDIKNEKTRRNNYITTNSNQWAVLFFHTATKSPIAPIFLLSVLDALRWLDLLAGLIGNFSMVLYFSYGRWHQLQAQAVVQIADNSNQKSIRRKVPSYLPSICTRFTCSRILGIECCDAQLDKRSAQLRSAESARIRPRSGRCPGCR